MKLTYDELEARLSAAENNEIDARCLISELKAQVKQLSAANTELCAVLNNANGCYKAAVFEGLMEALEESAGTNLADIVTRRLLYIPSPINSETTDAHLSQLRNEARAEGVEMLVERRLVAARLAKEDGHEITARDLEGEAIRASYFAKELRVIAKSDARQLHEGKAGEVV